MTNSKKAAEKYIMTVKGKEFKEEAIVYPDNSEQADEFIRTREHYEAIKTRLESKGYHYQIYKLTPVKP